MLVYVDPEMPGITRRKVRHGFGYWDARGNRITDRAEIERLNRIALPPAYADAWFCPSPHGHIQAIGHDARGRRQYRYHPDFRAQQDTAKYDRLADFGRALPLLRARVEQDLGGRPTDKATVCAAVVRLLDLTRIRIGNTQYARDNKSFGATTLLNRHARVERARLKLQYRGKAGVMRRLTIGDKTLLRVVRRVQDLPGQQLFQYLDDEGQACPVDSADVNAYIKDAMGDAFTAKNFRTWGASVIALDHVVAACRSGGRIKLADLLEPVAAALGNTPSIARKSYVHPLVLGLKDSGFDARRLPRRTRWLSPTERALIKLLDEAAEAARDMAQAA